DYYCSAWDNNLSDLLF
nr:immunoglobulin light chain junction region [Macaca mulatta]